MSVVEAAAVQQERIYVASGFVEDDYIRDDKQPTSTSKIANILVLGAANRVSATATSFFASSYTVSPGYLAASVASIQAASQKTIALSAVGSAVAEIECPGRLKWNEQADSATGWNGDVNVAVSWEEQSSDGTTFSEQQAAGSTWNTIEITEESPFG